MGEQPRLTIEALANLNDKEALMLYVIIISRSISEERLFRVPAFNSLGFDLFRIYLEKFIRLGLITLYSDEEYTLIEGNDELKGTLDIFRSMIEASSMLEEPYEEE